MGPSSSEPPYLVRTKPGIVTKNILTVGERSAVKMVGIPDGLGAFDNGDGTFTVLMNHEIGPARGRRDHGGKGAFVSKWVIDKASLEVLSGDDLIQELEFTGGAKEINRLCSGDLPEVSAFHNEATGLGTTERIYMSGEESGAEGRAFGHVVTGDDAGPATNCPTSASSPGRTPSPCPTPETRPSSSAWTTGGGQVYVYVGTKQATGNTVEKAGLTNGELYGVKVTDVPTKGCDVAAQWWGGVQPRPARRRVGGDRRRTGNCQ